MNDKVKSLFFSQYLGQKVLRHLDYLNSDECLEIEYVHLSDNWMGHTLLLRDISQLTDKETVLIGFFGNENLVKCLDSYKEENFENNFIRRYQHQLLLAFGVIRPFTYLSESNQPITLTPAEIIALGWAKLQSNEQ